MTQVGHVFLWYVFLWSSNMYFFDSLPILCKWSCFISNAVGWRWLVEDGNIHTANVGNDPRGTCISVILWYVFLWSSNMYFFDSLPILCKWSCFISNAVGWRWLGEDGNIHTANVGNDPRGRLSLADTHGPRGALLLLCYHNWLSYLMSSCHI